ncbi:MAG: DUF6503 family protein [Bacteroidia bacterium]|nr:DUF6503 family protein [Bacteroidia bacterium]
MAAWFCWGMLTLAGCAAPDAQRLVDQCIAAHGGKAYEQFRLELDFRDKHYRAERDGGQFRYERSWQDSAGILTDVLTAQGLTRTLNDTPVPLPDSIAALYAASVNSVWYFALLPYPLNDPAVLKSYIGPATVRQQPYHKLRITFRQEGGGTDFEDVFVYWIHQQTHTLDYLAYSYQDKKEQGIRFRAKTRDTLVAGIRFQDYINYKADPSWQLENLDQAYETGQLEKLSEIALERIRPY